MTPFECYKDYLALKNHFQSKTYDYHRYSGKSSASLDSFNKRKDKIFFEKLSKHKDPHDLMLSNFVEKDTAWVKDIVYSEEAETIYSEWIKKTQSLTYLITNDLSKFNDDFNSNFAVIDNQPPYIFNLYLGKQISLETICVLSDLTGCMKYWNKMLKDNPIWETFSLKFKKYTSFIKYDKEKIRKIIVDKFS